jgi:glycosyltransferase involved in cell wall biosynthesis
MKVTFLLAGGPAKASSRVRGYWLAEELEKLGFRCSLTSHSGRTGLALALPSVLASDAVVFQKTISRWHRRLMSAASRLGKATILDLDDWPSRSNNVATLNNVFSMMARSAAVTVGSDRLAEFAKTRQAATFVVPSSIRLASYGTVDVTPRERRRLEIGWIGNGSDYRDDLLNVVAPVLEAFSASVEIGFTLVGARGDSELHRRFSALRDVHTTIVDELDWADPTAAPRVISGFDVGAYPLLDNEFNRYKCGFKALEYMATGIPVVASPVGANQQIVEHGCTGLLAESVEDWIGSFRLLLDPEVRAAMGRAGREAVERRFTTEMAAATFGQVLRDLRRTRA